MRVVDHFRSKLTLRRYKVIERLAFGSLVIVLKEVWPWWMSLTPAMGVPSLTFDAFALDELPSASFAFGEVKLL